MLSECSKFIPNIFNPSKCSNCFKLMEEHNGVSSGDHAINKKAIKCGYLFIAPRDWDFTNAVQKSKRWQRRWFVLYDDGELTWSLDEQPDTIPQGTLDMKNVVEVSSAESITDNQYSLVLRTTTKGGAVFVKGVSNEEIRTWELKFKKVLASSIVPAVLGGSANLSLHHHRSSGPSSPPPTSTISSHAGPNNNNNNNNHTASINLANKRRMTIGGTVPPQLSASYETNNKSSSTSGTPAGSTGSNSTSGSTISISGGSTTSSSLSSSHSTSTSSLRSSRFHSDVSLMSPRGDPDGCGEKSIDHGPLRKGWLLKYGQEESCWCKYWFVLRNSKLLYFMNADEEACIDSLTLDLKTKIESVESTRHYGFNVNDWNLAAITNGMRGIWIKSIESAKLSPVTESMEGQQETPPHKLHHIHQSPLHQSQHQHQQQSHQQISSIVTAASPTGTLPPSLPSSPPATTSPTSTSSSVVLSPLLKSKKSLKWRKKAVMELKEHMMDKYSTAGGLDSSSPNNRTSSSSSSSNNTAAMLIQDSQTIDEIMYLKSTVRKLETEVDALAQERMILSLRLNDFTEKLYQSEKGNKQLRLKMNRVKGQSLKDKQVEIELLNKISLLEDEIKNYSFNQGEHQGPCDKCAMLEEQVKEREVKLGELEGCIQEMEIQFNKKLHELREYISVPSEAAAETEKSDFRVKYQREVEELKNLCAKGLEALENSHRRMIAEIEEKHRRETQSLRIEKEAALQEETNATLAALDALRKNHETELQRELTRFKEEFVRKFQDGQDLTALHREHEEELAEIKNEILLLSDKYSNKCLEASQLEDTIANLNAMLLDAKRRILELEGAGFLGVFCYNLDNNNDNRDPESNSSDCSGHVRRSILRSTSYQQLAQPAPQQL